MTGRPAPERAVLAQEPATMSETTQCGFRFGAALVERYHEIDGRVCIGVTTDTGKKIHVYVSRTGRSLRVFNGNGGEWTAPPPATEEQPR